jgi:hypothetical protein
MTHRSILSRLAVTSLAVALLATAPASAMPTDPQGFGASDAAQQDMHASTVQPPKEKADSTVQDAQGEAAASGGGTGSTAPAAEPTFPGPPTWPINPTPLPRPTQSPAVTNGGDDIGLDLPVALLILAGTLALGGGMAVAASKVRANTRVAH